MKRVRVTASTGELFPDPKREAAARAAQARAWDRFYALRDADVRAAKLEAAGTPATVRTTWRGRTLEQLTNRERAQLATEAPDLFARMRAEPEHALPKHPATLTWADLTNAQREHMARTDRATFDRLLAEHRRGVR